MSLTISPNIVAISTGVTGLGTGIATFLGTPSSANLLAAVTDETGTGVLVFGTSPTFTTSIITPIAYGSAASGGTLTLSSTTHATKGKILFGTSAYDEVNNRIGIGTAAPATDIEANRSVAGLTTIKVVNLNAGATAQAVLQANSLTTTFYFAAVNASYAGYGAITASDGYAYSSHGMTFASEGGVIKFGVGSAVPEKMRITSDGRVGIGVTSPTAILHLKAGTATASTSPFKFTSGTNLATAEAGSMEYNGTNLFFTRSGTTREGVLTQSAVTTEVVVTDTTVTVNIGGTTYKLLAKA